jgi:hypothetical protein
MENAEQAELCRLHTRLSGPSISPLVSNVSRLRAVALQATSAKAALAAAAGRAGTTCVF